MSKKNTVGASLVQYHANTEYVGQIDQANDTLRTIYINVADYDEHRETFNQMEDLLDELRQKLVKQNSNIATEYFKSQKS